MERTQRQLTNEKDRSEMPSMKRQGAPMTLSEYAQGSVWRDAVIVVAYGRSGYTLKDIGGFLELHVTRSGQIVRAANEKARS